MQVRVRSNFLMGVMWEGTAGLSVPVKEEQQLSATGFKQWDKGPSNERELVRAIVAFLVLLGCLNEHHNIPFLKVGLEQQETLVLCHTKMYPGPLAAAMVIFPWTVLIKPGRKAFAWESPIKKTARSAPGCLAGGKCAPGVMQRASISYLDQQSAPSSAPKQPRPISSKYVAVFGGM